MKKEEVMKLNLGLYRVFWKKGGSSLATIGYHQNGDRWIAVANWTSVPHPTEYENKVWAMIDDVRLLRSTTQEYNSQRNRKLRAAVFN